MELYVTALVVAMIGIYIYGHRVFPFRKNARPQKRFTGGEVLLLYIIAWHPILVLLLLGFFDAFFSDLIPPLGAHTRANFIFLGAHSLLSMLGTIACTLLTQRSLRFMILFIANAVAWAIYIVMLITTFFMSHPAV